MVGKSDEAMRTIGEVAESLDLPQHVLRFWETRFKQIDPLKRAGGRRFYRQRDIALVAAIRHLLYHEGYTIKGVQRILKERGVETILEEARRRESGEPLDAEAEATNRSAAGDETAGEDFPADDEPLDGVFEEVAGDDAPAVDVPARVNLPAVIVEPRPLAEAEARLLRGVLAEIEECKRLLKLTKR